MEREWTPVIDQHATCIAVNPLQGCPKACVYCFLNERGLTNVRPQEIANPEATLRQLLASRFYESHRVLALYTWTDVMVSEESRQHLIGLLKLMRQARLPNVVTLITKAYITDRVLDAIARAREDGIRVIVYLSYSGMGPEIERGVSHARLRQNFARLQDRSIPIIHYWRPVFPESAVLETMTHVLDLAVKHAHCSIVAGLKVEQKARVRLAQYWPELLDHPGVETAEGVYPAEFWKFVLTPPARYSDYPIYHSNSCALAYVLQREEHLALFGTPVCTVRNRCPFEQRQRCQVGIRNLPPLQRDTVAEHLKKLGYVDVIFDIDVDTRTMHLAAPIPTNVLSALTQSLGARVSALRDPNDSYWNSGIAGAQPLVLHRRLD